MAKKNRRPYYIQSWYHKLFIRIIVDKWNSFLAPRLELQVGISKINDSEENYISNRQDDTRVENRKRKVGEHWASSMDDRAIAFTMDDVKSQNAKSKQKRKLLSVIERWIESERARERLREGKQARKQKAMRK